MKPLSEEARAVMDAGKRGEQPTAADRERVRAKLSAAIAAGAVPALDPTRPLRWWSGGKLATAGVAAAVVAGGGLWWRLQTAPVAPEPERNVPPVVAVVEPVPAPVPMPVPVPVEAEAEVEDEPSPAAAPAPVVRTKKPRAKAAVARVEPAAVAEPAPTAAAAPPPAPALPPVVEDTLEAETRGLREVHQALRDGAPDRALALLHEQNGRFPRGQLREEREAAEVLARCAKSPEDGREALATFARQHPGSVLLTRLRKSCGP